HVGGGVQHGCLRGAPAERVGSFGLSADPNVDDVVGAHVVPAEILVEVRLGQVAGAARGNQLAAKIGCLADLRSRHDGVVADDRFEAGKDFDLGTPGRHAHEIVRVTKQKIDLARDQGGVGRVALQVLHVDVQAVFREQPSFVGDPDGRGGGADRLVGGAGVER